MADRNRNGKMAAPEERPTEAAFRALIRTYGLLGRAMQPFFMRFGITISQYAVLRTLHRAESDAAGVGVPGGAEGKGCGLRQTELGDRLLVRPPSVTGVIDRLQRQGWVTRGASPHDLRVKVIHLTSLGRRLVERVVVEHAAKVNAVLSVLSVSEQTELNRLLDLLGSHLVQFCDHEDAQAAARPELDEA